MTEEEKENMWDGFADMYAQQYEKDNLDSGMHMLGAVRAKNSKYHIDVGCGSGIACLALSKIIDQGSTIIGVDNSDKMVNHAIERFRRSGFQKNQNNSLYGCHEEMGHNVDLFPQSKGVHAKFYIGDALNLKFEDSSFNSYVSALVLMHVPDPSKMVAEAYRVLKSGSRASFSVVSPKTNTFEWLDPVLPAGGETPSAQHADFEEAFSYGKSPEKMTDLLKKTGFKNIQHWEVKSVINYASGDQAFERESKDVLMKQRMPSDPVEKETLKKKVMDLFEEKYSPGKEQLNFTQLVFVCEK